MFHAGLIVIKRVGVDEWFVSKADTRIVNALLFDDGEEVETGNTAGGVRIRIPQAWDGYRLVSAVAYCVTAGDGNTLIQVRNATTKEDMLSTRITLGNGETDSTENGTQPVIDSSYQVVSAGDVIEFDVDSVPTTEPEILYNNTFVSDISTGWLFDVLVTEDSAPVEGASVTITNDQDAEVFSGETDENGEIEGIPIATTKYSQTTSNPASITTTNHNPHLVEVVSGELNGSESVSPTANDSVEVALV